MRSTVWVSRALQDTRLVKNGTADIWQDDTDAALDLAKRAELGEPIPAEAFPTK